ncbi:hypothetical protein SAMN04488102_102165 [Alkalibacterium subtropicum]|uniref:Uncharacterized protein n=1 Tax=Alkalibacterium subtropicum TaxID=753702 RepID=A0A1I1FTJ3_9LACT|nr:hypothetical protein [Alkalibacterium subtropicum]SFC00383.1 hypothetical protein SAMN04488102_102165 [Alkalibacterium subtropicum]
MKKRVMISSFLILLIAAVAFGYLQYRENNQYESYLSEVLVNDVAFLSRDIMMADLMLDNVASEETVTAEELAAIKENYLGIHEHGNAVVRLADMWLDSVDNADLSYQNNPFPTYMSYNFVRYIEELEPENASEDSAISLTEEEIENIELMKSVNDIWVKAVTDNLEGTTLPTSDAAREELQNEPRSIRMRLVTDKYWDTYVGSMVNDEDWVDMVEQMQRETEDYETEVENIF